MATKSLGHLSLACGTSLSSTASCNMTSINGSASACDMAQFDCVVEVSPGQLSSGENPTSTASFVNVNTVYTSQGTRHAARIGVRTAPYSWSEDSRDSVITIAGFYGEYIIFEALGLGNANIDMSYDDGGYNDTGYQTVNQEVSK